MSDWARMPGVNQTPATIRHAGPMPVVRLNASLKRTPDWGGEPASAVPASSVPASEAPASGAPLPGVPPSGVPPPGGGDGRGVAFGAGANTSATLPLLSAFGAFASKHGTSATVPGSDATP